MQAVRQVAVLPCVPTHSVLTVCSTLERSLERRVALPPVDAERLDAQYAPAGFTAASPDDSLLVAVLKATFGCVHPVSREKRKCNRPNTAMPSGASI